jgi:predicted Zn-dependent protease
MKDPEPQPPKFISLAEAEYSARHFYGDGMGCNGHADMRSEITYLRDWKSWAERQLKSLHAWERNVNEALNSGDGSYRP